MGRSPCCEKIGLKKGPWTPEEDQKLLAFIEEHGHGSWRALPGKAGLQRCGKSCRLRWTNYLRPDIKRGKFSLQEEQTIIQLHALLGNRWSAIATHLPKRTDNEIKNYWNTHLKKRLAKMGIDPVTHKPKSDALSSPDGHSKSAANLSHMAQWESARLEAEARLARESKLRSSTTTASSSTSSYSSSTTAATASTTASFQQLQLGASASAPPELQTTSAPSAPPPCVDVLQAWQGVWAKPANGGQGVDLESPTSTLSFSENAPPPIATDHNSAMSSHQGAREEVDWKSCDRPMRLLHARERVESFTGLPVDPVVFATETPWLQEALKIGTTSTGASFGGDGFTDMLLDHSDDQNSSGGCTSSANAEGGCHVEEESKDYWNSILSLVNSSSPTNSPPVF